MQKMQLSDINILDLGNTIQIAGMVWSGNGECFLTTVPGKNEKFSKIKHMELSLEEWSTLLHQVDTLETEMFQKDPSGITKVIVRKSQRQIDSYVQWAVFKRDGYRCRYCGREGVPLTVDHVDLWESGGATEPDNLVSACRSCNKNRGRMDYDLWLRSNFYSKVSKNLTDTQKQLNEGLVDKLPELRKLRFQHTRGR